MLYIYDYVVLDIQVHTAEGDADYPIYSYELSSGTETDSTQSLEVPNQPTVSESQEGSAAPTPV